MHEMKDIRIVQKDEKLFCYVNPWMRVDWKPSALRMGGEEARDKWNNWALVFPVASEKKVRKSLLKMFGTDGTIRDAVTLRVEWIKDHEAREIWIGGYFFAKSKKKGEAHLTANPFVDTSKVVLKWGGSHANPYACIDQGSIAYFTQFPRTKAEKLIEAGGIRVKYSVATDEELEAVEEAA